MATADIQRSNQQGSVIPLVAMALLAIMGITGMVFDASHLFVNKTRAQNALDAAALAAAKVLDRTHSQARARQAARTVFDQAMAQSGNGELRTLGLDGAALTIQFSDTRNPFIANPAATRFVRARLNPGSVQVKTLFMTVLGVDALDLSGSALAGPSPTLGQACKVVPSVVCGDPAQPPNQTGMYGYRYGDTVSLALGSSDNNATGPGNFQLISLDGGNGGDGIRAALAGQYDGCVSAQDGVETKPGANRGPVAQGFNTRFGIYQGPVGADDFPPDLVTDAGGQNYPDTYADYQRDYTIQAWDEPQRGIAERRVLAITFGDCRTTINGQGNVPVLGFGCVFLNEPANTHGALQQVQISGELVRSCSGAGVPGPSADAGPGPHTIQLYGDPDRWDS